MKTLIFAAIAGFSCLLPSVSFACTPGDTSKVLLVIHDSDEGEEDKVVGEISTSDNMVAVTSRSYFLRGEVGNVINLESLGGHKYSFDRRKARWGRFCFKSIFGEG